MPAGYINDDDGVRYMVSVGEEFSSAEELSDLVLFDLGIDGVEPIRLSDVATVFSTDDSDEIYTKLNGENGILASFTKQSTYATAEVSKNISARFDQLSAQYEGLHFTPLMDQGDYISLIVRTILSSLLWGALFSVLVLFLFLRDWRPTIITLVSIPLSLVFAIVEIGMAVFSGSQAVLLDAVYDSVEFFMMLPSIFLIPLLYRPSSEQHPFGYTQIETGFVVVKGAIMAAVTFGLIFNNIHLLLHGGHKVSFHTISAFELFACLLSLTVAICLYFKNKHMSSPLVNIELQTWKIDCVVSLGMAVAFLLPIIVPFAWFQRLTPYLDQIITIILSAFMLPTPIKTVITGLRDLMLWPPEAETVDDIKATVEPIIGGYGHKNLYYDIVRTGRRLWISVYITFDKDIISLSKFQILQTKCIAALAEKYQDFYFELLPDIQLDSMDEEKIKAQTEENT